MPEKPAKTLNTKGKRFPKAAVDYVDALLSIQRQQFEAEKLAAYDGKNTEPLNLKPNPTRISMLAEGENFVGSGWSSLGKRRDGTAFRWMGRIGTLLLPVQLEQGGKLLVMGCGYTRKKLLQSLTVWIDETPVEINIARKGFNRWIITGNIPPIQPRAYHILRIESAGLARLAVGLDSYFSVAVSSVEVKTP